MNGAADEKSPGTRTASSDSRSARSTETDAGVRRTRAPAAASISSVWSREGACSMTVVRPAAPRPASSTADFTWALATGSSYSIPCSCAPRTTKGARPSVVSTPAPMRRSGSAIRSIGRERSDSSPVSSNDRPSCEREQAGQQPHERAGVPAVDRPLRLAEPQQPDAAHDQPVDLLLVHLRAERAHGGDRRLGVPRPTEPLHHGLAFADRADQHRAVRDRLVAGDADVPGDRGCRLDAQRD